jgi:hypothetical protein
MPPSSAPSATKTFDQKTPSAFRIRTMASDLEAIKKGSMPSAAPVTIDLPKEPAKSPPVAIKPSFPKIIQEKPQEKSGFSDWLRKKDEIMPTKIQPFLSPIKGQMIPPKQQTTYVPPPNLPTTQTPQNFPSIPTPPTRPLTPLPPPVRPLTPPPPPRPPMPQMPPQMQKLPTIPLIPVLPPIKPSELPKTKQAEHSKKGRMVAIIIVSIFVLAFIAGEIWWFFLRETSVTPQQISDVLPPPQNVEPLSPEIPITPDIVEPVIPSPILFYSRSEIIDLETLADVSNLASKDELVRLVIKFPTAQTTDEYADIAAIAKQLAIKIPADVSEKFLNDFDIFLFGGNSFDEEECKKAKNTDEACYGPRLGIAVKVSDPKNAISSLKNWEKTMATDLKPMILAKVGNPASFSFLQNLQNKLIRYKNMPINTITVEYAIIDDVLIIATSKSAIFKAIDSLQISTENTTE